MPMEENGEPIGGEPVESEDKPKRPRAPRVSKAGVRTKQPNGDIIEVDGIELDVSPQMPLKVERHRPGFDLLWVNPGEVEPFCRKRKYEVCTHAEATHARRDGIDPAKQGSAHQTSAQVLLCRPMAYLEATRRHKEEKIKAREKGVSAQFKQQARDIVRERRARGEDDLLVEQPKLEGGYLDID